MEKLKGVFGSRKFWAVVFALVLIIVKAVFPAFPLSEEQLGLAIAAIIAYITGTALETGRKQV